MNNTALDTQNPEILKSYINLLLDQLTVDYKNTKEERKTIASLLVKSDDEFTVLEELELLTVNIRGYVSQILVTSRLKNQQQAIVHLHSLAVIDISVLAQFYLEASNDYPQIKAYIRTLDYMRSLLLEYLVNS